MNHNPIQGARGQILAKLDAIFYDFRNLHKSKRGLDYFFSQLDDEAGNKCNICIIRLPNGYLVETDYPDQTNVYERLWMCDPELGRITYVESSNPNFKIKDYFSSKTQDAQSLEFHALPEDIDFLNNLLNYVTKQLNSNQKKPVLDINNFKMIKALS